MALPGVIRAAMHKFRDASPAVKASMAYMVCTFLQKGVSLLTTPIFTRLLTTEQYGYYSVYNSWLAVIKIFSTLMLAGTVYMQAVVKFQEDRDRMTGAVAGLGTMTTLTVTLIYLLFREQINALLDVDTLIMTCILITAWEELLLDLWAVQQRVDYAWKRLVALTLAVTVLKPALGILSVLATEVFKAEARIVSAVAVDVVAYSGFFVLFIRRGKTLFDRRYWKYFLAFSIPLLPHFLTRIVLNHSDTLMIKALCGESAAGIYNLAHSLAWMLTLVTNALLNTINPWIFQRIRERTFDKIGGAVYLTSALVAGAGLCLTCVAPEAVRIFAPAEYHGAVWLIPPLVASVFFTYLYSLFSDFEYYYEAKANILLASVIGGVLNIALNYVFIGRYGYVAAGWTTMACFVFLACAHFAAMRRILRKREGAVTAIALRPVLLITAAFLLLSALCMLTYDLPVLRYAVLLAAAAVLLWQRKRILQPLLALRRK
ncbi:MAG: oligosaccharide flippase family protein [Clostridia bacterium]|nr:oligosaccharide flippase family protein [Clostridia bacterium]